MTTCSTNKYKNPDAFAVIRSDGSVVTWGMAERGGDSSSVASKLTNVTDISSTTFAFAALKKDGSVVTWGSDYGGDSSSVASQLTNVSKVYSNGSTFAALKKDGTVVIWGDLGVYYDSSLASQMTNVSDIYSINVGFAVLKKDGTVVTFGSSVDIDSSSVASQLTNVSAIYSNFDAFAALKKDGSVVTWGNAAGGGDSSAVASQLTNIAKIYSADHAFAALKKDGTVVTWGAGGDSTAVASQLTNVSAIYSTAGAFAALKKDGSVVTWDDAQSQYGGDSSSVASQLTNVSAIYSNYQAFAAVKKDGTVVTWGGDGGDSSAVASQLTNVSAIYSNYGAFAALKKDGSVVTWGDAQYGGDSSSVASKLINVTDISSNGGSFAALKKDGSVVTWGWEEFGGDSSAVASQLNGTIDVVKFNDTSTTCALTTTVDDVTAIKKVFDADGATQLYQDTKGKYFLSDADQSVGNTPNSALILKSDKAGKTNWAPATGQTILAIDELTSTTEVLLKKGTGTTATYSKREFDNATGKSTTTAETKMTLTDLLAKESSMGEDLNGDGIVGEAIAKIVDTKGLYQTTSNAYVLSDEGQSVGESPITPVILKDKAGKKLWAPATGQTILAIDELTSTTEVLLKKGTGATATYSKVVFDNVTGNATTAETKMTLTDLLAKESSMLQDLNGDEIIGEAIAKIVDTKGLYQTTSNAYVLSDEGQSVGESPITPVILKDKAGKKLWAPATGQTILATDELSSTTEVLLKKGTGTTATYSKVVFDNVTGNATTAETKMTLTDLLAKESSMLQDLNGDEIIGEAIAKIVDTKGLYQTTSNAYVLSDEGQSVGESPITPVILKDKAGKKIWAPATGQTILATDELSSTTEVLLKKGTGTTATYSKVVFDNVTGNATTAETKMTLTDLLAKESSMLQDLNGDEIIGEAIAKIVDTKGLYQTTSNAYVLSDEGQSVGESPITPVILKDKAGKKLWAPATGQTILAIDELTSTTEVLLKKGTGATATYSKAVFDNVSGNATVTAEVKMSAVDVSTYEIIAGVDLNGDGLITSLRTTLDNHVYDLVLAPTDWTKANTAAKASKYIVPETGRSIAGALVSIEAEEENMALLEFVQTFGESISGISTDESNIAYFWTSGNDAKTQGSWIWGTSKNTISTTDTRWSGAPDSVTANKLDYLGVAIEDSTTASVLAGQWNDLKLTDKLAYLIEYTIA